MSQNRSQACERILTGILLGANLLTVLLLWTCVLSTYLPPNEYPRLSLLGLLFPVFLCVDLIFVLLWLLYKAHMIWLPLGGLLVVSSFILDYCPINQEGKPNDSVLCIISYNAGGVEDAAGRDSFWTYLKQMKPDIVCVQEVSSFWFDTDEAKKDMQEAGFHYMGEKGTYVLSRFPLAKSDIEFHYETVGNNSFACWALSEEDSILIVCNHLESNRLSSEEKSDYREMLHSPNRDIVRHEGRSLLRKLSKAASLRGLQVDTLCEVVLSHSQCPMIVCGDFNDTPISYTYRRLSDVLNSAYRQSGLGFGFSFNQDEFFVRIDHIFFSSHWVSRHTFVDQSIYLSDHYPIVSYLERKRE